jgi:hypothetical protein
VTVVTRRTVASTAAQYCVHYCGAVLRRSLRTAAKSLWSPVDEGALTTSTPQYSHSRVVLQLEAADGTGYTVEDDSKADAPSAQM